MDNDDPHAGAEVPAPDLPHYRSCEIELEFADGFYPFKFNLKCLSELQIKCDAGIGLIYERVCSGHFKIEDLVETVRLGLIGGGLDGPKARRLIEVYAPGGSDQHALEWWHRHAVAILAATIHGYSPPDAPDANEDEKKTETVTRDGSAPQRQ